MQFSEIYNYQVMNFKIYTIYNKHEMIKVGNETREKSQVLLQQVQPIIQRFT